MRKCLFFIALLVAQFNVNAQSLFNAPDTVCQRQPVQLTSNVTNAVTHYWGFCSGYLFNKPTGDKISDLIKDNVVDIDVVKEGDKYYGFVITSDRNRFLRLEFGTSLFNTPTVTDFGNFNGALPTYLNSLQVVKDEAKNNLHVFITAGLDQATSEMARIDFRHSWGETPNIVNFGNVGNVLDVPHGMFIEKEGDKWYGFTVNKASNNLVRIDFDTNISLTPVFTNLGGGALIGPHDIAAIKDNNVWYLFITNETDDAIVRLTLGNSLTNFPTPADYTNLGNVDNKLAAPTGITIIRDCDSLHAFVTNKATHELIRINMPDVKGPYSANHYGNPGDILIPTSISRVIRDRDDLFLFIGNKGDASISRVKFEQCKNSSIAYSLNDKPPAYSYDSAGRYNLYYAVDEGLPTMRVECKNIDVIRIPPMFMTNDTVICQGDTIGLQVLSINALSLTWTPNYNISSTSEITPKAWPDYSTEYRIILPFANGCIVDTNISVKVNKIKSDAGPDRVIADGSQTLLGGPLTTVGYQYAYNWFPAQYLSAPMTTNPVANPPYDFTYYLEVTDTAGCKDVDTVIVRMGCKEVNLPNAFVPNSKTARNTTRFGLLNQGIIKLNHFRIFDRWGKEVFSTTDPTQEWDGTINGELAPTGVYIWNADGFCVSGQRIQKTGNVTLLR